MMQVGMAREGDGIKVRVHSHGTEEGVRIEIPEGGVI